VAARKKARDLAGFMDGFGGVEGIDYDAGLS
jgi:hypothetical protein